MTRRPFRDAPAVIVNKYLLRYLLSHALPPRAAWQMAALRPKIRNAGLPDLHRRWDYLPGRASDLYALEPGLPPALVAPQTPQLDSGQSRLLDQAAFAQQAFHRS